MRLINADDADKYLYDHLDDLHMIAAKNAIDEMPSIKLQILGGVTMTLDEFNKRELLPEDYIVRMRYKYSHEKNMSCPMRSLYITGQRGAMNGCMTGTRDNRT